MKHFFILLFTNLFLASILIASYINLPAAYHSLDNRLRDFFFINRGQIKDSQQISIVTIDEESLKELGQWPWERPKIARILNNLYQAGAVVIGMDMFFAETDKSSPKKVLESLNIPIPKDLELPDHDLILAQTMSQLPVVLGYIFDLQEERNLDQFPMINAVVSEINFNNQEFLPLARGVTLNLEMFQQAALSSGFINNIPDASGIIRSVPLLIKYQEVIFSSLVLEIYRLLNGIETIEVIYQDTGISSINLLAEDHSINIPTDRNGRLYLDFLGPQKSFTYISAKDVYLNQFDHKLVKDRVIFFGATSVGLMDLRATPFENASPGVEVHATALENMLNQKFLHRPDWAEGATTLIILCIAIGLTILYSLLPAYSIIILMFGSFYGCYKALEYLMFEKGIILNILFPMMTIFTITIITTIINYFLEAKQRKAIRHIFAQKVSANVVDDLLKKKDQDIFVAQQRDISILFSDIRSFTNISEQLDSPRKLIDLLNIYMTPMVQSIMQHKGTVDKFIGDAIMAYWNAPFEIENHADKAVTSALEQIQSLDLVNQQLKEKYQLEIDIGIGINTGLATIGEMGSKGRSDYTAIGDSVNLASRLEGLNKNYGSHIIISEFTMGQLQQSYAIRELDKVRVKGKKEAIRIYEVLPTAQAKAFQTQAENYQQALYTYYQGDFATASKAFARLNNQSPQTLYQLYLQRCEYLLQHPPEDFDGVYTFTSK